MANRNEEADRLRSFKLVYDSECRFCAGGICYIKKRMEGLNLPQNASIEYIPIVQANVQELRIDPKKLRQKYIY